MKTKSRGVELTRRLERQFSGGGGYWTEKQISEAVNAVMARSTSAGPGWRWWVGTPGSIHHTGSYAPNREEAEAASTAAFDRILSRNPVLGTLDYNTSKETPAQFFNRLVSEVAECLNQ